MFLTKEGDYGIRIIRALANGEMMTEKSICDIERIPVQYAYKILKKLESAGFVQSFRGRNGGYKLVKPLSKFTIFDIVSAVDKNLLLFECLRENNFCPNNNPVGTCIVHDEFERIQKLLETEMNSKTISDLLG